MENLRCVVERITYQNEQNGYSVIKCKAKGYNDIITVVGAMPEVHFGAVLSMTGEWKMDAKFGRQFSMISFEETLPATVYGIEKYLGSGLVKGIGPKFASRIVKEFGAETLNVIEERPDDLIRVAGIGKVRVERIKKSWAEQKEIKISCSSCRAITYLPHTRQRYGRPMERRASKSSGRIRTGWRTISGASALKRQIR